MPAMRQHGELPTGCGSAKTEADRKPDQCRSGSRHAEAGELTSAHQNANDPIYASRASCPSRRTYQLSQIAILSGKSLSRLCGRHPRNDRCEGAGKRTICVLLRQYDQASRWAGAAIAPSSPSASLSWPSSPDARAFLP
jgi:hypothetical protein